MTILGIEEVKPAADITAKLTDAEKTYVVTRLASYDTPGLIAKSMNQDLGIEITRQAIAFYDPTRYSRRPCPKRWSVLFWKIRAEVIAGKADVGAAHPTVRVRRLDQMACEQMEKGNAAEARALLKQAAEEMSRMAGHKEDGSDENHRRLIELSKLTDDELDEHRAAVAAQLNSEGPGGRGCGDRIGAAEEPQPVDEPLSG